MTSQGCPSQARVVFAVDTSGVPDGTRNNANFNLYVTFLQNLAQELLRRGSSAGLRIAQTSYSTDVRPQFNFDADVNRVRTAIGNTPFLGGRTNTPAALTSARQVITQTQQAGTAANTFIVLFTDGPRDEIYNTLAAASAQARSVATVITVGIRGVGGSQESDLLNQLLLIVANNANRRVIINGYSALQQSVNQVASLICGGIVQPPGPTPGRTGLIHDFLCHCCHTLSVF